MTTDATSGAGLARDRVLAVVLNWNGEADSVACLESLRRQEGVTVDLLIVDNDSADGSGPRLRDRFPGAAYLQTGANLGYAGGNDAGIAWALARGARWVLVVNNDTVADAGCVRALLDALRADSGLAMVAPLITRFDDPSRTWFAGGRFSRLRALGLHVDEGAPVAEVLARVAPRTVVPSDFLSGCCLLLRREAIEAVGVFRADYFAYVEDAELSLRMARAGWRLAWVPAARLAHRVPPAGRPDSPLQIRLRDRNRRRLVRDHYPWAARLAFHLWFWPTRAIHLARFLLAADWPRARAIIAGLRER